MAVQPMKPNARVMAQKQVEAKIPTVVAVYPRLPWMMKIWPDKQTRPYAQCAPVKLSDGRFAIVDNPLYPTKILSTEIERVEGEIRVDLTCKCGESMYLQMTWEVGENVPAWAAYTAFFREHAGAGCLVREDREALGLDNAALDKA